MQKWPCTKKRFKAFKWRFALAGLAANAAKLSKPHQSGVRGNYKKKKRYSM